MGQLEKSAQDPAPLDGDDEDLVKPCGIAAKPAPDLRLENAHRLQRIPLNIEVDTDLCAFDEDFG